jgi:TetR/AcrR family acrAB operon transcriptional repressor
VFEILTRKCEYVDELHSLSDRILHCRAQGLDMMERALRNAMRKGQLPRHLIAARAALGLHAYVDGLIYDWMIDPRLFALGEEAEALVDQYLDGLRYAPERVPMRQGATVTAAPRPA